MKVAIMRPKDRLLRSAELAREMGMVPVCASPLNIEMKDTEEFLTFLDELSSNGVDVLIFTSAMGVKATFQLANERAKYDELIRGLNSSSIVSIGAHTSSPLERIGVEIDFMPKEYSSKGIVSTIPREMITDKNIWILRSNRGSRILWDGLQEIGGNLNELVVYNLRENVDGEDMISLLTQGASGRIDAFPFTSSLTAGTFLKSAKLHVGENAAHHMLTKALVGAIGQPTKKALELQNIDVDVVAKEADFRKLLEAIKEE